MKHCYFLNQYWPYTQQGLTLTKDRYLLLPINEDKTYPVAKQTKLNADKTFMGLFGRYMNVLQMFFNLRHVSLVYCLHLKKSVLKKSVLNIYLEKS